MRQNTELYSFLSDNHGTVNRKVPRDTENAEIRMISLDDLYNFAGHPFKVEKDLALIELMESIQTEGVIVPALARPRRDQSGYELISGHRRKAACRLAGIKEMPVMVKDLDDDQAAIAMVDSNLQRENLKPSEKAFAYKIKLNAMKHQGKRRSSLSQVGTKSDNASVIPYRLHSEYGTEGEWKITEGEPIRRADELLARQVGESRNQIARYIRLTNLIPKILDMVDEGRIAFTVAVELSYLNEEEQYELHAVMDLEQCTPSLSQANRMKRLSQNGGLDMDKLYQILEEVKPNQREQIRIRADVLDNYFPKGFTLKQKAELIEKLVKEWHEAQNVRTPGN